MSSNPSVNNIWARLRNSVAGVRTPNSYALLGQNGELADQPLGKGRSFFVDTVNGSNSNDGRSWSNAFLTMAKALSSVGNYDNIYVNGVIKEQCVAPLNVFDVTIIGAANRPRQATSGGNPTGGGACWLAPGSPAATTALLELINQSWSVYNMMFSPVASSPCIQLTRAEDAVHPDPSHASIIGCRFVGGASGAIGIQDSGGCHNVMIADCIFQSLGGHGIKGIAGAGIATPLMNQYLRNYFNQNTNDIEIGGSHSLFRDNVWTHPGTAKLKLGGAGDYNVVIQNHFASSAANISIAGGYTKGGANDTWRNFSLDTAAYTVGVPA